MSNFTAAKKGITNNDEISKNYSNEEIHKKIQ